MVKTLTTDYGRSAEHTEGQVRTVLKKLGYTGELEEIAIVIFCNEEVAKKLGLDEALIKKYRGYSAQRGIGHGGYGGLEGFDGGSGGGGGSD